MGGQKKNDGTEDAMIRLWNEGLSASEVAAACHIGSRNVVIGRINRLLLKGDLRITRAKSERPKISKPIQLRWKKPVQEVLHSESIIPLVEPDDSCRVSILQVSSGQCRWIVGGGKGETCCGHPAHGASSWCEYHCARVFGKTKKEAA